MMTDAILCSRSGELLFTPGEILLFPETILVFLENMVRGSHCIRAYQRLKAAFRAGLLAEHPL
jgi:hypothetical protein